MPAENRPMASIFCVWRSCSSRRFCSIILCFNSLFASSRSAIFFSSFRNSASLYSRSNAPSFFSSSVDNFSWLLKGLVSTQAKRQLLILLFSKGGGVEDERYLPELLVGPPFTAEEIAVHHRHEDVGDDQVRRIIAG